MRRLVFLLTIVSGCLAVSAVRVNASDCYYGCDPKIPAGTSTYDHEFCCPGLALPPDCVWEDPDTGEFGFEEHCALVRIDYWDDAGAGLWGPLQETGGYMAGPKPVRYDVYYGECEDDHCIYTASAFNTWTRLMDCCANCPV